MSTMGERIKLAREALGITGAELARRCGVTRSAVWQWENGNTQNLKNEILYLAAAALEVRAEWLVTGKGVKKAAPKTAEDHPQYFSNVEPGPILNRRVPLVSWVMAGNWCGVHDPFPAGVGEDMIDCMASVGPNAYALRVRGDSMVTSEGKGFPDGCIIIVDPDAAPNNGAFVIVRIESSAEATFKQLVTDGGKQYLKPLNQRYPIMEITERAIICGVVKQKTMEEFFD